MKRIPIKVSDHAALRYLQRVKGLDLDALKDEIAQEVHTATDHDGVTGVRKAGFRYILDNSTVVTITHIKRPPLHTAGRVKDHRK